MKKNSVSESRRVASGTEEQKCRRAVCKHGSDSYGEFEKLIAYAREQIEVDCFNDVDRPLAERIAVIVAEIYILPAQARIQIDSTSLPAEYVAGVLECVTAEDVKSVIDNIRNAQGIRFLKSYVRTALYNAVFENELRDRLE